MATATQKTTTKKTATKRPAKKSTASTKPSAKAPAKKAPAKKAAAKKPATPSRLPLREREPIVVLEDAGYAVTGVIGDVVEFAKTLPGRAEGLWRDVEDSAKDAPKRAKELRTQAPTKLESQIAELRERLTKDTERLLASFEKVFDSKAAEGRKLADQVKKDERIATLLERTATSRSQVKAAVTSATKTADVAIEAGRKQLDVARSQAKGAVTAATKAPEKAREASEPQARAAKSQAKAAATSLKRSAEEVAESAS
jgi:hypothetical protein